MSSKITSFFTFFFCLFTSIHAQVSGFVAPLKVVTSYKTSHVPSDIGGFDSLLHLSHSQYFMELYLGSPPQPLAFHVDTGSDLTWTESSTCMKCFHDDELLQFDKDKSSTYAVIAYTHGMCKNDEFNNIFYNDEGRCAYDQEYGDKDWTVGLLFTDVLSALSDQVYYDVKPMSSNYFFGNSKDSKMEVGNFSEISGILGLMPEGKLSLLTQLNITSFSHCLYHPLKEASYNIISFGNRSSLVGNSVLFAANPYYSVVLYGISVGPTRLSIPKYSQQIGPVILDTGTTYNHIYEEALEAIITELSKQIGPQKQLSWDPEEICFEKEGIAEATIKSLPNITFHLRNYDFVLSNLGTYSCEDEEDACCISFLPAKNMNIIGNYGMIDYNIGYDLKAKRMYFQEKNCSLF